ncbi:MAG: LytTR family DNA-binding domain-containing protein [Bacillales bacterium]|nr:LytTR family DNA-binding domain-containing protein [Bacillales bacterium]
MKRIIIVDDNKNDQDKLSSCIQKFYESIEDTCEISCFFDGVEMLKHFNNRFDMIFLDIDMPGIDGISVAKKIREIDEDVVIIFVSNLPQFALKGYEVAALDFIVKPYDYANIEHRLKRANRIRIHKEVEPLILKVSSKTEIVPLKTILYVEKDANYIIFHTENDQYTVRGSLADFETVLLNNNFSYCVKGVIVNLSKVIKIANDSVYIKDISLPLSRHRKKEFTNDLFNYLGSSKGEK